jgi:hypothetical protein
MKSKSNNIILIMGVCLMLFWLTLFFINHYYISNNCPHSLHCDYYRDELNINLGLQGYHSNYQDLIVTSSILILIPFIIYLKNHRKNQKGIKYDI